MALKRLRLLIVNDQKVEVMDFPSYEELKKFAAGEKGSVTPFDPTAKKKPAQKTPLIGNSLRDQVQNNKSSDNSGDS